MKLVAAIIEGLWGIALPIEQLAPLFSHCAQSCLDLLRLGR